jgi:O-antigen/teichoic acid export membrane protein
MKSKPNDEGGLPQKTKVDTAARVVRNSSALFAAAALAKGGGLVVTILVARYLGASSLGVYAVVLALALLLEALAPLGQQEVVVRAIARDRSLIFTHWVNASGATLLFAFGFSIALVFVAQVTNLGPGGKIAIYVAAIGLPVAALEFIARSVLQGFERMEFQTLGAFAGTVFGLLVLWILLESGAGIWSAFLGRAVTTDITSDFKLCHSAADEKEQLAERLASTYCYVPSDHLHIHTIRDTEISYGWPDAD